MLVSNATTRRGIFFLAIVDDMVVEGLKIGIAMTMMKKTVMNFNLEPQLFIITQPDDVIIACTKLNVKLFVHCKECLLFLKICLCIKVK